MLVVAHSFKELIIITGILIALIIIIKIISKKKLKDILQHLISRNIHPRINSKNFPKFKIDDDEKDE